MKHPTILVVDDRPDNLTVFAAVIGEFLPDATVLCAGGAEEAFTVVERHAVDAILLDVQMPGMSGIETCRKLKSNPKSKPIPVILITAKKTGSHERADGLNAGADDFLSKPIDNEELIARLQVALRIKHAEDRLRQSSETQRLRADLSEAQSRSILQTAMDGYWQVDLEGRLRDVNEAYCRMSGYTRDELLTLTIAQIEAVESSDDIQARIARLKAEGELRFESRHRRKDGTFFDVEISAQLNRLSSDERINAFCRDISARKRLEREREASIEILRLVNGINHTHELIQAVTGYLHEWSGCEAVGIRLKEGDDYPYFETRGFPPEFVAAENALCVRSLEGQILRDAVGNPILECMCGNIIQGRFDPSKPFFTEHGSFWSNGTTELLASTTEADRQARTRNRCNGEGYESVALIPLRFGGESLGLIQLNDHRRDRFSLEFIHLMERMADSLAIALAQRQAERALRDSEVKYRTVAEFTYDWEFWRGPDGQLRYCSPSCERITGYAASEFLSDPELLLRITHPDDRKMLAAHLTMAEESTIGVLNLEFRITTRHGEVRWLSHICAPVSLPDGTWLGRRASNRDITERKQADAERQKLAMLADSSSEFIGMCDLDMKPHYVNPAGLRMVGLPDIAAACQVKVKDYFFPEDQQFIAEEFFPRVLREGHGDVEIRLRHFQTGKPIWMFYYLFSVRDASGKLVGWATVSRDISERKQADEALRASEERYQRLTHAVTDYIYTVRMSEDGSVAETVHGYGCEAVTGYRNEEFAANPYLWLEMVAPQDRETVKDLAKQLLAGEDTGPYEHRIVRKDGQVRWVRNTPSLHKDAEGRLLSYDGLVSDISDRKEADRALHESEIRYRSLFDNMLNGFAYCRMIFDDKEPCDFIYLAVNQAFETLTGLKEVAGKRVSEVIPGILESDKPLIEAYGRVARTGVPTRFETCLASLNMWFAVSVYSPSQDHFVAIFDVITERKRMEMALRDSEAKFRAIAAHTPDHILMQDRELRYQLVINPQLGLTEADMLGRTDFDFLDRTDAEKISAIKRKVLETAEPCALEASLVNRKGDIEYFDGVYVPKLDEQGRPDGLIGYFRNVTERKGMVEALRQERDRVQKYLNTVEALVVALDCEGRITLINPKGCRLLGRTEAELLGKSWFETCLPQPSGMDEILPFFKRLVSGEVEPIEYYENPIVTRSGKVRQIAWHNALLRNEAGQITGVLSAGEDITERKQAEEQYQTLFREMLDGFALHEIILNTQGQPIDYRFLAVNPAFERLTGLKADALIGKTVLEVMPRTERHWIGTYGRVALTGEPAHFENYAAELDRHFEVTSFRPAPNQFACMFVDVTARKRAEEAAREGQQRLALATSSAQLGIWDWDIVHNKMIWDDQMFRLYGISEKPATYGVAIWENGIHPDDRTFVLDRCQAALRGEKPWDLEFRVKHPDGSVHHLKANGLVLRDQDGKPVRMLGVNYDITERKQAENALRDEQERLRTILDTVGDPIFVKDNEHRILLANRAFFEIFGLDEDAALGKTLAEEVPEDERRHFLAVDRQVLDTGTPDLREETLTAKGKATRTIITRKTRFIEQSGKRFLVGSIHDISERELIRRRTELRAEVLAHLNGPLMEPEHLRPVLDLIRKHVDAKAAALRLREGEDFPYLHSIGMSENFLLSESLLCTYCDSGEAECDAKGRVKLSCLCGAVISGRIPKDAGPTQHGSFICSDTRALVDSRPPWLVDLQPRGTCLQEGFRSLALIPLHSAGETVGMLQLGDPRPDRFSAAEIAFVEELSEGLGVALSRQMAERALRLSEERYRSLVNAAPTAIAVQTREGIQYANPTAMRMLGFDDPTELLGRSILESIHPDDREVVARRLRTVLEDRKPIPVAECRVVRKDHTVLHVESQGIPTEFAGQLAVQIMALDRTAQRQLEQQLQQSQKMESLGQLAGGVAHDFNNHLTAILGNAELLLARSGDEGIRANAEQIVKSASRSADLTRQLLAFARRGTYAEACVDVHAVLEETCDLLGRTLGRNVQLRRNFSAQQYHVFGDASLLQNAFLNLGINARDAMPDGGCISYATSVTRLPRSRQLCSGSMLEPGEYLEVRVTDTGTGIPDEVFDRIFEPFFTTKPLGKGTGLGLAAVLGTIKRHGGAVDVESSVGKGTTFKIFLPLTDPAQHLQVTEARGRKDATGALHVLLVDDEEQVVSVVSEMLRSLDHTVIARTNGHDAIAYLKEHLDDVDLVMLDMNVPGLDGSGTFYALRALAPDLPVLIATGEGENEELLRLLSAGARGVIQKPYRMAELSKAINTCFP